jgi:ABC-type sugar transport system permease subunit
MAGVDPPRFVGLANYRQLAADPIFWHALENTGAFALGSVAAAALIGLALALLSEDLLAGRFRWVGSLLLTPWAVPFVVTAFLFRYMYLQTGGIINALLSDLGLIAEPVRWLNASSLALLSIIITNVWSMAPFFFLLMSAALAGIPAEVIESARVDRAGAWSMIVHIKLPFLKSALLIGSLIMVIANLNDFAKIWAMTQGGPGYSTTTLVVYVYRLAFESFNFGYASAVGVVWLALLFAFAVVYLRAVGVERR